METDVRELSIEETTELYGGEWWYFYVGVTLGTAVLAPMLGPGLLAAATIGGVAMTWY
jgi:hypothetical protein